jgi:N-acetylmuramoyl-L-alanine amidase
MRAFWGGVLFITAGVAQAGGLRAVNLLAGPDATRIVLETPAAVPYHVFTLGNPDRVVVDLHGVRASHRIVSGVAARGVVRAARESVWKDGARIVFDVSGPVSANSFVMAPSGAFGNRIILDLAPQAGASAPAQAQADLPAKAVPVAVPSAPPAAAAVIAQAEVTPSPPIGRRGAVRNSRHGPTTPSPVLPDPKASAVPAPIAMAAAEPTALPAAPPPPAPVELPPAVNSPISSASSVAAASSSSKDATDADDAANRSEAQDAATLAAAAAASAARAEAAPSPAPASPAPAPVRVVHGESPSARPVARIAGGHALRGGGKPIIVAIDAGHGGYDPGAIGFSGVQEKDVCLAMARKLEALVDAQPGMHAVLTRDGDYFVELRQRMVKARAAQADVFVSIHANSYPKRSTHGAAVYVLSAHGASSEQARWVANHENAADLVGGVDLQSRDEKVAAVLLDISQSATMEASFDLAGRMLDSLREVTDVDKPSVQQAGFMVLKSPDIPSILIETAFITNPEEERALASEEFEGKMAHAILQGLLGYFDNYRPQQPAPAVQTAQRISAAQPVTPQRPPFKD